MAAVLVLATLALIIPQVQIFWDARDALCAGDLNFVADFDSMGLMSWAPTSPLEDDNMPQFRPWKELDEDGRDLHNADKVVEAAISVPKGEW